MSSRANSLSVLLLLIGTLASALSLSSKANDNLLPVTALFQKRAQNGTPIQDYRPRYAKGEWIKVGGFADSKYFYGQVQLIGKRKVAGYLFLPRKREPIDPPALPFAKQKQDSIRQEQIYVYGELIHPGEFRVFDQEGTLYRLIAIQNPR